jgi:integrase
MATLVKDVRNRSPFWICCYTASDGRRLKKSTKQTDRKKALEVCLALDRAESMARQGTFTEARARELVGEVLQRTSGESLSYFTVEEWFRHWVETKKESKAGRTGERYQQIAVEFVDFLGGRAKLNIAAITPKDILGFRKTRTARGLAPSTVNLDVKIIGAAFNAAKRQGYIPMNPAAAIESLPFEKPEKHVFEAKHIRVLMNAAVIRERGRLIFEAGEDWRGAILFAFYTGGRLQDVANMRWESIDLPNKLISYAPRKTRGRVVVPIHPELETYLLNLPAPDTGKAFVFPKLAGDETGGRSGLSRTFARIMARARIEGEIARKANKEGRTVRTLTFHSLRHSFSSAMANAGVAEELRMKLTGHATREVHAKYTHHELDPLRAAIATLPSVASK